MPMRPCLDCGALSQDSRCPTCKGQAQQRRDAARGSSARRGYGYGHRARRSAMLPTAYGKPCARCGEPIMQGQALDAGHTNALAHNANSKADRIEHANCNRKVGGATRRSNPNRT